MNSLDNLTETDWKEGQLILVDKPLHWTSFQTINKIRWLLKKKFGLKKLKVGHAGTLDPLATGLLLICVGKWTKRISEFQGMEKEYTGTIQLGATTPSYDLETEIDANYPVKHVTAEVIESVRDSFMGEQEEYPPVFSAIKKEGVRLYEHARKGDTIEVSPRKIHIHTFSVSAENFPELFFCVKCSKGTYIRSLAYDFGKKLHSGAYLSSLRRTEIGSYTVTEAYTMEDLIKLLERD